MTRLGNLDGPSTRPEARARTVSYWKSVERKSPDISRTKGVQTEDQRGRGSGRSTSCPRKIEAEAANGDFDLEEGCPALEDLQINPRASSPKCTCIQREQPPGLNAPHMLDKSLCFPRYVREHSLQRFWKRVRSGLNCRWRGGKFVAFWISFFFRKRNSLVNNAEIAPCLVELWTAMMLIVE